LKYATEGSLGHKKGRKTGCLLEGGVGHLHHPQLPGRQHEVDGGRRGLMELDGHAWGKSDTQFALDERLGIGQQLLPPRLVFHGSGEEVLQFSLLFGSSLFGCLRFWFLLGRGGAVFFLFGHERVASCLIVLGKSPSVKSTKQYCMLVAQ
jgi:hypothetical protein